MACQILGDIGLVVHNARNPSREEWSDYLTLWGALMDAAFGDLTQVRQLVFTDGGGPNGAQRRASTDLAKQRRNIDKVRVAVVTRSVVVRGMVTAYRWLGLPIRAFQPEELALAFAFLAVTREETLALCDGVEELCAQVHGPIRSASRVTELRLQLGEAPPGPVTLRPGEVASK